MSVSVVIPDPGGLPRCGTVICGQAICGMPRPPDDYSDFALELDGGLAFINPVLRPLVCADIDLSPLVVETIDLDPLVCQEA